MKKSLIWVLVVVLALVAMPVLAKKTSKKAKVYTQKQLTKYVKGLRQIVKVLQADVETLKTDAVVTKTYEGKINLTAPGDETTDCQTTEGTPLSCHWKRVNIPELDLTKSPNVQLLTKQVTNNGVIKVSLPAGAWQVESGVTTGTNGLAIDNGKVYILYKGEGEGAVGNLISGDYKVIITYKK